MTEARQPSKRFIRRSAAGATLKGPAGVLRRPDTTRQPAPHAFASDVSAPGDPEVSAKPAFDMGHFQHAEIVRGLFDQSVLGVALVGLDARIELVNRALAGLLRYSQAELEGMTLETLLGGPGGAQALLHRTETFNAEHSKPPSATYLAKKSGGTVRCRIDSHAIHDENGKTTRFLVFASPAP